MAKDYTVQLDAYHGPLDLLLHLVKRHEVDLLDIPIAELTDQYLDHVRVLKEIDVERAGDFLLMAATLLEIKSRMLSPRMLGDETSAAAEDDEPEAEDDPRYELVQQLLAYKRFKDAAVALEDRHENWAHRAPVHARPDRSADDDQNAAAVELDVDDLHVMDLCQAFGRMLDSIGQPRTHDVSYDETPIALHAADIEDRLERDGGPEQSLTLRQICEGRSNRAEMIGLFLAMLELVREKKVAVVQDDAGEVALQRIPEDQREDPNRPDPSAENAAAGDDDYHWPDEAGRRRHERRQRLRAARARGDEIDEVDAQEHGDEIDEHDDREQADDSGDTDDAGDDPADAAADDDDRPADS